MVTIIAVQTNSVIVVYSQQFYQSFSHNGSSWQTNTARVNMEATSINLLVEDSWFEESDFSEDVECTMLLDGQTAEEFFFEFEGPGQSKQESGNTNNSGNHGVINYNFYNQQWQNSVDLEHAMENNATAYGGTGGGDSAHTNNRWESSQNLLATGMQLASGILPLLADSTTEEFENSDRIGLSQAGASTLVTQHMVGMKTYRKPKVGPHPTSAADEPTEAGPSVQRYVTIPVGQWVSTNGVYTGWALPLPYCVLQQGTPVGALARRHYLLNCGWKVQVQVNSTRFHGGALGVFMVPQFVNSSQADLTQQAFSQATTPNFNLQSMFVYPHQILNPRTNSSVEIEVPYANKFPSCNPVEMAPWTLVIMVLEPLTYSTGATTSLEVVASLCPVDAIFHGIRQPNADFQGLPKNQNASASYGFATTQAHYAEPVYGAMTRSSPAFLPCEITDLLQIARIPTLTNQRVVTFQQQVPTAALMSMNVSLSATDLVNTALETVSRGFGQYRGSICVTMMFVGNQMQNVRFVGAYTPPGADPPTTVQEAMNGIYTIYDTGLNSTATFVIPFISVSDYRVCNTVAEYDVSVGGYFTIWQLTNLAVPPGSPTTAALLVFAAAGEDFEFRCPTVPYLTLQGEDAQVTPAESGETPPLTAENTNENVVPIPYVERRLSPSALRFWFDRFFPCAFLTVPSRANTDAYLLTWDNLTHDVPEIRWFMHATYFRFELELAFQPLDFVGGETEINMVYYPPGTLRATGNINWNSVTRPAVMYRSGACPNMRWNTRRTPVYYFRVPFDSPATTLSQTWTGWPNWAHTTGTFGQQQANSFGAIQFSNGTDASFTLRMSFRMVDLQCWCPRPGLRVNPPQNSRGATNFSLLQLAGDVEENPGPFFMKCLRRMEPDLDEMFKKFEGLQASFKKVTDFATWIDVFNNADKKKWFKKFLKFLSYGVILSRARHDPLLAAATAFLLSGDWLTKLCCKIVKWLKQHMKTAPPPLPACGEDGDDKPAEDEPDSVNIVKKATRNVTDWLKQGARPKGLSVNSGDIKLKDEADGDVPMIDLSDLGPKVDYPSCKNPFGPSLADGMTEEERNMQYIEKIRAEYQRKKSQTADAFEKTPGNPFEEDEPEKFFEKFKRVFKFQGPIGEMNQILVLCRNAQWLGQQVQKILDWLGIWKKQEEDASEEKFKEEMQNYPAMMHTYEQYKNSPRHSNWEVCKNWFDKMRKLCMLHDPKLVTLFPNMAQIPHENSRQEPLLVVLRGPPGQGKSVAAAMLAQMCAYTLSGKPDYYSYNSSTNYFDGYQQQPVVLIDDLGQDPSGTDFSVFCQMISTTPFLPNMASLQDKGIKFKSDIIIATTNLADFRPNTIADPGALARRINFDYTVEAGAAYRTSKGTLDLAKALTPTTCSSPLQMCKCDIHMFSSACVKFRDRDARCDCSLVDVYDRVMAAHKTRNDLACKLQEIFKFEGPRPKDHDPRVYVETYPIPTPRKKEVEKWCDLAIATDPRDDEVLSFLRKNCDHVIFGAYLRRFYGAGPDPLAPPRKGPTLQQAMDAIGIITQVLALLLMVFSLGVVVWQLFSYQGAYGGNSAGKRDKKPNGLKVVDIASFQGPMNFDLEKSLLAKNMVSIAYRRRDGTDAVTGGVAIKGRIVVMNNHLWQEATHLQLDGEWMLKESIPAVRPAVNGEPSELVFMNWAKTPGRQFRDISGYFPRGKEGHFKLSPAAKITGIVSHQNPSFMFMAESLGTADKARTWEAVVPMVLKYRAQTAPGFCGALMVVDNGIWKKAFGIHCAGAHGVGMAAIISQEMLEAVFTLGEFQGKIHTVKEHPYIYTPHKTQLYPTVACDDDTTVEPAALSINDKRLAEPTKFKQTILAKHVGDRTDGPLAMLRGARFYARLIRAKCGPVNERLSLHEAVYGTDNLDPMDQTRSPGWPYIGSKRRPELLWQTDNGLEMDPVLRAELMSMQEGNFSHHKFVTFLKDELRDKDKVRQGKTRVIDIASYGHAIMGRILFGRLAAAMHANNGVDIGSAVGTNPDIDWTRYAAEFRFKNFVDVDYSGFDATHSSFSFYCLKVFLQELGFDEVALKYVDSLCNSTHIWDDEEFQIQGGLPSGCSCTSIFNTIINNIVVRSLVPEVYDGAFQMLAYGDDLVLCAEETFPVDKYKEVLEEVTNYKITPASKSGTFEWTDLSGVVFLKRYFYRDGLIVRPVMTYKNLHNILSYARAGTVQEKLNSVARLAQHRGEQDYKKLMQPFEDCGYVVPSFDDLELEFFSLFFG
nr:polyprotein [Hunnivirus A]